VIRPEAEVFADLARVCQSPGYVHALAHLCWRDNLVRYAGQMKPEDMQKLFTAERLIRTELSTLLGLMVQSPWQSVHPGADAVRAQVEQTDALLQELHSSMPGSMAQMIIGADRVPDLESFGRGTALREPIFYGGESAYIFQYRDFSLEKYASDSAWLLAHKGFDISDAHAVILALARLQDEKSTELWRGSARAADWFGVDLLPAFRFDQAELAQRSAVPPERVQAVLAALTLGNSNAGFRSLASFNAVYAQPLLSAADADVLQFMPYATAEALYESPFYWMLDDRAYRATAATHRGDFTETFTTRRLRRVFGDGKVHRSVRLVRRKGELAGEIDVLVVFGDRVVLVQNKSKRLTQEARKGNDQQLKDDFAKAIQDAYDQAQSCAELILEGECALELADGQAFSLPAKPKEMFLFMVIADHYPALSFQAGQFLKTREVAGIRPPFVMDVFLLDAMTEMLDSPLRLLTYASLRAKHAGRLAINHELTTLGYHLKLNLWLDDEVDFAMLQDDLSADLDLSMSVRRDGVAGARTPPGILTKFAGTRFGDLLNQLENRTDAGMVDLGLLLMTLGEDTCRTIDERVQMIMEMSRRDGRRHDFTIGLGSASDGITFHCNTRPGADAREVMAGYCYQRKYAQKADRWFGLSLDPHGQLQFGLMLEFPFERSADMDARTASMRRTSNVSLKAPPVIKPVRTEPKVGRNDLCACGSGKKYKKCCL
jgi:hypothetical protein